MNDIALILGTRPLTWGDVTLAVGRDRPRPPVPDDRAPPRTRRERTIEAAEAAERAREMDDKVGELTRIQSEMTGRMRTMAEVFGSRQSDFVAHDLGADRRMMVKLMRNSTNATTTAAVGTISLGK